MDKHQLSERDICTKFITPALEQAGWDIITQVREEFPLTKGRIIVRGKLHTRAQHKPVLFMRALKVTHFRQLDDPLTVFGLECSGLIQIDTSMRDNRPCLV